MSLLKTLLLATAALPMIGIGALQAADAPKNATPNAQSQSRGAEPMKVSTPDYVKKAAMGDMFEIESSRIAAEKATDKQVKNFAQKMVKDHSNSSEKLKETLTKAKVSQQPPTEIDAAHKAKLDKLRAASGQEFDRLYIQEQQAAHREAWELHNGYAKTGDNNDLKKTAGDISKTVQAHMKDLDKIQKDMQSGRGASSSRGVDPAAPATRAPVDRGDANRTAPPATTR